MPKQAEYRIVWEVDKGYEVMHAPFSYPMPDDATLQYWLAQADTFSFCSPTGHTMTLRKERKARGSGYWYAYRRVGSSVRKKYLGERSNVTLELLARTARLLVEPDTPQPPPAPPRKPTLKFTRTLDSALSIYGFRAIPTRRELIGRYRELSKQHHPDTGGLHEDMVAVNLAYEYLKSLVR